MRWLFSLIFIFVPSITWADQWSVELVKDSSYLAETVEENRPRAKNGLPDGLIARTIGHGDILSAWYEDPTTRYGHGILGDAIEAGRLVVKKADGKNVQFDLDKQSVFEDRYPRLKDLDGDGTIEIITIKASLTKGASVTVYGLDQGQIVEKATSGYHGRANRWLNIAGIADFAGSGTPQVAFVRTPHIGGNLHFYQYNNGAFASVGKMSGFSNHVIGSHEMRLSAVTDIDGNGTLDIALPSNDRRSLRMIGFRNGKLKKLGKVKLPSRIDKAIGIVGAGRKLTFVVGTNDNKIFRITRK